MDFLRIDGSFGEGGGQIVRTAVTLSCVTGIPVRVENIRGNRGNPGLRAQHVTAIGLLGDVCDARIRGLEVGSASVDFSPGAAADRKLSGDVGTAGSIPLILQVLVPAVSFCGKRLTLSISGGTDVPYSPTIEYTRRVLGEAYGRTGIGFSMDVGRRGYYPRGGGLVRVQVFPCKRPEPIVLDGRKTREARLYCSFSGIPTEAAGAAVNEAVGDLEADGFKVRSSVVNEAARDRGGSVLVMSEDGRSVAGVDALYEQSRRFGSGMRREFTDAGLGVDGHLADMLVVPASLADGMSVFRVSRISSHLETNLYVASKMTGCRYGIGKVGGGFEVRISGSSYPGIQ